MATTTQPNKQAVRDYMERRRGERVPPPTPEEIRRQLGWGMLQNSALVRTR